MTQPGEEDAVATAVDSALSALRHRDRSAAELDARLARRGVGDAARAQALETLERVGYVDDERFALQRAEALAGRGAGDELIRHDLEGRGVPGEAIEAALGALEPERERAAGIVAARGWSERTARHLAAKGFGEDTLEAAAAVARDD